MNTGKYVFSQATGFLSFDDFNKFVKKYKENYKIKTFSCWNQLLCMLFGQLAKRESLSDLVTCLQTQQSKWYHLGLGTTITKSNLAYANENRDGRMYADFAYTLIAKASKICTASSDFELKIDGNVYAIDSTTIDLCLSVKRQTDKCKNSNSQRHKASTLAGTQGQPAKRTCLLPGLDSSL